MADPLANPASTCQVCGEEISPAVAVYCSTCASIHHRDCWKYAGRCATFACGCETFVTTPPATRADVLHLTDLSDDSTVCFGETRAIGSETFRWSLPLIPLFFLLNLLVTAPFWLLIWPLAAGLVLIVGWAFTKEYILDRERGLIVCRQGWGPLRVRRTACRLQEIEAATVCGHELPSKPNGGSGRAFSYSVALVTCKGEIISVSDEFNDSFPAINASAFAFANFLDVPFFEGKPNSHLVVRRGSRGEVVIGHQDSSLGATILPFLALAVLALNFLLLVAAQ